MISKELLSEVLGNNIDVVYYEDHLGNKYKTYLHLRYGDVVIEENIAELAFKCKIWALENDWQLLSCLKTKDRAICDIYSDKYDCKFTHYAESEYEAIFKASDWILEKVKELK